MKAVITLLFLFAASTPTYADKTSGGFTGPDSRKLVTTLEVDALPDDAEIKLVGYIVRKTGDEKYEFKDEAGVLIVEIDDDVWRGLEISPEDKVELIAEVDRERAKVEIEVDSLRRVQ